MKAVLSVLLLAALTGAPTALFWRKYIFVDKQLNWTEAQAYCRENYVDLITIETQAELDNYQKNIQSDCYLYEGCWTGLSGSAQPMKFTQWSDERLLTFTFWGTGEPSTMSNANCVYIHAHWHNDNCTKTLPFVCYIWKPDQIVVQEMKTWEEALKYCRMNYTDLVILDTDTDHLAVNSSEILTPSFWNGLRFLDGSWFWVNRTSMIEQRLGNLSIMPSCPAPAFRCGAQNTESDVLENRDCEEEINFICYDQTMN